MGIEKTKNGEWSVNARIRISGKIVQKRGIAKTKEAAKILLEDLKNAIRNKSSYIPKSDISTFAAIIDVYKEKKGELSRSHMLKIELLKRELGHNKIYEFADRFEAWLKVESKIKHNVNMGTINKLPSPAKVNRYVEIARAAFNVAFAMGVVEKNPITKERFPKLKEVARDKNITVEQEEKLLSFIQENRPHLYHIAKFALRVPARKNELVYLRVEDVDLFNKRIRIKNNCTKTSHGTYKPIPPEMIHYFETLPKGTEYAFYKIDKNGKAVPLGEFSRSFKWCLKQCGIVDIRFHDTRHISATQLIDNGTPSPVVTQIAGWKTDMLRTYYSRQTDHMISQVKWTKDNINSKCEPNVNQI